MILAGPKRLFQLICLFWTVHGHARFCCNLQLALMGLFSKSFDPITGLPDLSGKVIIVTGGKCVASER